MKQIGISLETHLAAPHYVGGATIEGQVAIDIDAAYTKKLKHRSIYISKLSIDVVGVEEVNDGRK